MVIERLLIHQFRNIKQADITLSPGLNGFVGDNGSGKTSLLEAIYTLGHGRAFRSALTSRIINNEAQSFTLHARLASSDVTPPKIGLTKDRQGGVKVKLNEMLGAKISDLAKNLPMQLITPEGFSLIDGGPKFRRAYVDWGGFHHYGEFYECWTLIKRLIKQRNAALKQCYRYSDLKVWDDELVKLTLQLTKLREQYCESLIQHLQRYLSLFLPSYDIQIQFYPGWNRANELSELLMLNFEKDKYLGFTQVGAHKADLRLSLNKQPVESLLSRGQLKLLMCAMRLAQGHFFSDVLGRSCLYLLDDFSSELDNKRQKVLAEVLINQKAQVCMTALNTIYFEIFLSNNMLEFKCFNIHQGEVNQI